MPTGQPFTRLCQALAHGPLLGRADLHLHTTCSDGIYTPEQVVRLSQRCGLAAIALTDHDTLAGIPLARQVAADSRPEIVSAVEITTEHQGRELHLLAYFIAEDNQPLNEALASIRRQRGARFRAIVGRLRQAGVKVPRLEGEQKPDALGRRYLAELLVRAGQVGSVREAFARYLKDGSPYLPPPQRLATAEAIDMVRQAHGVACWAHPGPTADWQILVELKRLGLGAVEVDYPEVRRSRQQELRSWASRLDLAITGGSDCHGPGRREVGCCSISSEELERVRCRRSTG